MPGAAIPSTHKGNDIRADVILAEEFEGQISRWHAFMTERVDALFPRYHRPLIILHVSRQAYGPRRHHHRGYHVIQHFRTNNGSFIDRDFNAAVAARQVWLKLPVLQQRLCVYPITPRRRCINATVQNIFWQRSRDWRSMPHLPDKYQKT
jgi:hypothetical protein